MAGIGCNLHSTKGIGKDAFRKELNGGYRVQGSAPCLPFFAFDWVLSVAGEPTGSRPTSFGGGKAGFSHRAPMSFLRASLEHTCPIGPIRISPVGLSGSETRGENLDYNPTRRSRDSVPDAFDSAGETHEQAVSFMLNVINATIYSSGDNYEQALVDFFPQLEALGHLIGAGDLDEISFFMRRNCRPL